MPAASDDSQPRDEPSGRPAALPQLPVRYRPLGVRFAVCLGSVAVSAVTLALWFTFPQETRDTFTFVQLATVLALAAGAAACGHALARCRVDAHADGLTIVNGYKRRDYEWTEIVTVTLRPGSPWVELDISDGTTVSAMGIQGSDGLRAQRQVRELRALVDAHSIPQ